jgi:hypothetical protein
MLRWLRVLLSAAVLTAILPPAASAQPHDLVVDNAAGSVAIASIKISPPTDDDWGDNWLATNELIGAGRSRTFSVTLGCSEDIRITFADHEVREWRAYDTCRNTTLSVASAPASGPSHDLVIFNASSVAIRDVEISPPANDNWGENWLGASESIAAGQSRTFTMTRGCAEDIRVTFASHRQREWPNYDTCAQPNLSVALATPSTPPHDLTITNAASGAIEYVQISPTTDEDWGDDWLGPSEVIAPGSSRTFSITGACAEDIRVTFMDQRRREWRGYDTCRQPRLHVDPLTTST